MKNKLIKVLRICLYIAISLYLLTYAQNLSWFLDLFSHFRNKISILTIILSISLIYLTKIKTYTLIILVSIFLQGYQYRSFFLKKKFEGYTSSLKIIYFNLWYRNDEFSKVLNFLEENIKNNELVILGLLETTPIWKSKLENIKNKLKNSLVVAREDCLGMSVYTNAETEILETIPIGPEKAPAIFSILNIQGKKIGIVFFHLVPPTSLEFSNIQKEQIEDLISVFEKNKKLTSNWILFGDFNLTPWSSRIKLMEEKLNLKNVLIQYPFINTWNAFLPSVFRIPIENFLISDYIHIKGVKSSPFLGSDHLSLVTQVEF